MKTYQLPQVSLPKYDIPYLKKTKQTLDEKIAESENLAKTIGITLPGSRPEERDKMSLFDFLEIARFPITAMLYETARQYKEDKLEWNDIDDIVKAGIHGWKNRKYTRDIINLLWPDAPEWVKAVGGAAGDIISDPATWITFGMGGGLKGGAQAAREGTKYISGVTKYAGWLSKYPAKYKTFVSNMIKKWGGKTLSEAIQNAAIATTRTAGKAGLYARIPFTKAEKLLVKGAPSELIAKGLGKFGVSPQITKAVKYLPSTIKKVPVVGGIYKAFSPYGKIGPYRKAIDIDKMRRGFQTADIKIVTEQFKDVINDIDNVIKAPPKQINNLLKGIKHKGTKQDKIITFIRDTLEKYGTEDAYKKLPKKLQPVAQKVRTMYKTQFDELVKRGILKKEQYIPNYFPRYFEKADTGELRYFNIKGKLDPNFTKLRTFKTAKEAEAHGFKLLGAKDSMSVYFDQAIRAQNFHDYLKQITAFYGTPLKKGAKYAKEDFIKLNKPGFERILVPKEIGEIVNQVGLILEKPDLFIKAARWINKGQNVWKKQATVWWGGFHVRNYVSNGWTYIFADGLGPKQIKNYENARRIVRNPNSLKKLTLTLQGKKYTKTLKDWNSFFTRSTAHSGGFGASELREIASVRKGIGEIGKTFKEKVVHPAEKGLARAGIPLGRQTGVQIENSFRIASMMNGVDKGLNLTEAALRSNRLYIDYASLTPAERVVTKFIPFYCVPETAEILTKVGWKKYTDLKIGEDVLTYNVDKNGTEWQPVEDIAVFNFDDELVHIKNKTNVDFLCTEDHRWPVETTKHKVKGKLYDGERKIIRTYKLNTTHSLKLSALPLKDRDSIITPRDAAIIGWIVTDGTIKHVGKDKKSIWATIYQSPKKYADEIRELIKDYGAKELVHPTTGVISFPLKASYTNTIKYWLEDISRLPELVSQLSNEALEAMYDAMIKAEGTTFRKNNKTTAVMFSQLRGPVLDAFQIICQLLGKSFYTKNNNGYVNRKYNNVFVTNLDIFKEHYKGKIWCPKTANSTWIMRQNGRPIITGNTWLKENMVNQVIFMMADPGKYSMYTSKALRAISWENQDLKKYMPEWMKENQYVMSPFGLNIGGTPMVANPNLPFQDPYKYLQPTRPLRGLTEAAIQSMSPFIKLPFELAGGTSLFTGRPIAYSKYDTSEIPPAMSPFVRAIPERIRKKLGIVLNKNGIYEANAKVVYALYNLLPLLRAGENIRGFTKPPEEDYKVLAKKFGAMSRGAGIKLKPFDPEYYKKRAKNKYYQELKAKINKYVGSR